MLLWKRPGFTAIVVPMGRLRRPHLPGVPFHITARAQNREAVFVDIESTAVARIVEHLRFSDVLPLAWAVMPNHIHLVVVQGARPLSALMHPLMRRLALLVMRTKDRQGHIFQRRYFDTPCLRAQHLRNAIAYVHLNGCRAALCADADSFEWCSHRILCESAVLQHPSQRLQLGMETALRMFARREQELHACCEDYRRFLRWRIDTDRIRAGDDSLDDPEYVDAPAGDLFWVEQFGKYVPAIAEARRVRCLRPLRDMAIASINEVAPGLNLDDLRDGSRERSIVRVRRHLVPRALLSGHTQRTIAAFLNVSQQTISDLAQAS